MMIYYLLMLASVLVSAVAHVLLKKAAQKKYANFIREYLNVLVICGYALLFGSTFLTIFALRGIAYTSGQIIEALGYCLIMVCGRLFFQEKITWKKLVGNFLIISGVLVFYC